MSIPEPKSQVTESESMQAIQDLLEDLLRLLEEYGPTWYSEELHDRVLAAIANDRL